MKNITKKLLSFITDPKKETEIPTGLCPNCWGKEEYGGRFYQAVYKHDKETGWVQDYAEKNLKGILLKKEDEKYKCPTCKLTYKSIN